MYGYSRAEAIDQVSNTLLKTRFPEGADAAYAALTRDGAWEGRLVQTRKDGSEAHVDVKWVVDKGAKLILEVNREVTEHVLLAERFQVLVQSVQDYAIFLLDAQGRVATWNEGARRIKGYRDEEIIGRNYSVFYTDDDQAEGIPEQHLARAAKEGHLEYEGWRLRKDGTRFWAAVVLTALHDGGGRLSGYAKVTRDMTAKQLERQRLEELERSKSTFLNLVAHELRSPLTVLRGYLSLFRGADPATLYTLAEKSLPALEAKIIEMSRLVDQMVEVARLEEGSLQMRTERFDMGATVERAVNAAQMLDTEGHRIYLDPYPGELHAVGDEERISIILSNLLSNAMKYSPDGGDISVAVRRQRRVGLVSVADEGVGIKPEDQPRLFSPFTRVGSADLRYVPGTGMGLYLSRELARRQGGDLVLVRSGPDGSEFALTLPLAA